MIGWVKKNKWILLILLLAIIVRLVFIFQSPIEIWDETVYANLGYDLSNNFFDYSLKNSYWTDFIPGGDYPYTWPNIGFRAPVLPYTLSLFYLIGFDWFIPFFITLIGIICVFLVYYLGKLLFDEQVAIYSALCFSLIPLAVLNSSMIFTGTYGLFFFLLALISFWKGFELDKNLYKILFGVFFALSILTRYTLILFGFGFLFYFIFRNKGLKFMKDKYFWGAVLAFLIVIVPWFIYGRVFYGNFLGGFIHGILASTYWGGKQAWYFFLEYWWDMFSITGIVLIFSFVYLFRKKLFLQRNILFMIILFFNFLILSMSFAHKEQRFLLPIVIPLVYLVGFFISKNSSRKILVYLVIFISLISLGIQFYDLQEKYYHGTNECFLESLDFIKGLPKNSLIINDESSVIYYYTHKKISIFRGYGVEDIFRIAKEENTYLLYSDVNLPLYLEENEIIKENWDQEFEVVFNCDKNWGVSTVYKIN